jgi:hypothetical protein
MCKFDKITPITKLRAFTPTSATWTSNVTFTGFRRQVLDVAEYRIYIALSGAPDSNELNVNLIAGEKIDTRKFPVASPGQYTAPVGYGTFTDGGVGFGELWVAYKNATSVIVSFSTNSSSPAALTTVTATAPITWANTDTISLFFSVPVRSR